MVTGHRFAGLVPLALAACLSTEELVPPTADQDPALPQVALRVAGHLRAVHLERHGDPSAPVLLVLHGSLSDFRSLRPLQALSDRYHVILWDQRGNGLSERIAADEYTFDSIVEEIARIKERFSPDRPVTLVGHSFGASYAVLYTSRRPDDVAQIALLEPPGLRGDILSATFADFFQVDLSSSALSATYWQNRVLSPSAHAEMDYKALLLIEDGSQLAYFCDREHPPHWPLWRPGAYVDYVRGLRMGGSFSSASFRFDFTHGVEQFPREVLLVGSSCSALGAAYQRKHHQALFREARVVEIEGAGHRMTVEQPEAVIEALRGYLEEYRHPVGNAGLGAH